MEEEEEEEKGARHPPRHTQTEMGSFISLFLMELLRKLSSYVRPFVCTINVIERERGKAEFYVAVEIVDL